MRTINHSISNRACVYGGYCIEPGNPSDCEINSRCFNFKNNKEKTNFDKQEDIYELILEHNNIQEIIKFKTRSQLVFFLRDIPNWREAKLHLLGNSDLLNRLEIE